MPGKLDQRRRGSSLSERRPFGRTERIRRCCHGRPAFLQIQPEPAESRNACAELVALHARRAIDSVQRIAPCCGFGDRFSTATVEPGAIQPLVVDGRRHACTVVLHSLSRLNVSCMGKATECASAPNTRQADEHDCRSRRTLRKYDLGVQETAANEARVFPLRLRYPCRAEALSG